MERLIPVGQSLKMMGENKVENEYLLELKYTQCVECGRTVVALDQRPVICANCNQKLYD